MSKPEHNTSSGGSHRAAGRLGSFPVLLAFAAVYLIWGSTYLAIRIGIETLPPFLLAGVRFCVAGSLLYLGLRLTGTAAPSLSMWKSAALIGALMMFGGNGLVTWAQQEVPSGLAALLVATVPIWMLVLDALFYGGGRPDRLVAFGLVMGSAGLFFLVGPSAGAVAPRGAIVLLLASLFWALGSLLNRSVNLPDSPWMAAALQMITGGVLIVAMATATGEWSGFDPSTVSARSIGAFLYLVIFGSIVGLSAYVYLLRETSAAAVSTYAFVNPVIALALGWLTGEVVSARTLTGAAMIVGAVFLIHRAKHRPPARRKVAPQVWKAATDVGK